MNAATSQCKLILGWTIYFSPYNKNKCGVRVLDKSPHGVVPGEKSPGEEYVSLKLSKNGQKVERVGKMVESRDHCYRIYIFQ